MLFYFVVCFSSSDHGQTVCRLIQNIVVFTPALELPVLLQQFTLPQKVQSSREVTFPNAQQRSRPKVQADNRCYHKMRSIPLDQATDDKTSIKSVRGMQPVTKNRQENTARSLNEKDIVQHLIGFEN